MFKKIVASVVASLTLASPALATSSVFAEHQELWGALNDVGITTYVNHEYCYDGADGADGFYVSSHSVLVVCQDNATDTTEVQWTANDLDTLRHEAHHVIQDCKVGSMGDGRLGPVFDNENEYWDFVLSSGYTEEELQGIASNYRSNGANDDVIITELEAFAVARSVSAENIAVAVLDYCGS